MAAMAKPVAQQAKIVTPEPEVTAYTIKRDGPNFRIVTYLIRGDRVLAMDESDEDLRASQLGRIELALRRIP